MGCALTLGRSTPPSYTTRMGMTARSRLASCDRTWSARIGAAACAASLCICCGSAEPSPRGPAVALSPYSGRATELFDDVIEPSAVGYQGGDSNGSRQGDALIRERTQTGDAVIRARVVTVTSEPEKRGDGWRIGLRSLGTLAGKSPPAELTDGEFTFVVDGNGPAAGVVRMLESRLVGATFVVFVRQFEHERTAEEGDNATGDLHFHFAKDDKDELSAVNVARLLGEVR
jgi:hypothetical protein